MGGQTSQQPLDTRRAEVAGKLAEIRDLMAQARLDAVHLSSAATVAWLTAGATTSIDETAETAAFSALVTQGASMILTDGIEAPRLREEEALEQLGFTLVEEPWHTRGATLRRFAKVGRVALEERRDVADELFWRTLRWQRATLGVQAQARLRTGARLAAQAMNEVARSVRAGMSELEVAARLGAACRVRGGSAIVTLVGADDRIARFRHPIATDHTIDRYAMLVLCFRYRGLVSALTRLAHIGEPPAELVLTARTVALIDARMLAATRAGRTLADMFEVARSAYRDVGHPEAIEEHHQGGPLAYRSRESLATPGNDWRIASGQAFAWNPSLRGAKSEDTILLTADGAEVVTQTDGWPLWRIEIDGAEIDRPAILALPALPA
ncbi:MAG TPA: M24 family metallopeptidase [Ktedonobacterales bacterium]